MHRRVRFSAEKIGSLQLSGRLEKSPANMAGCNALKNERSSSRGIGGIVAIGRPHVSFAIADLGDDAKPVLQACLNIPRRRPRNSLNWISVSAIVFLSSALRSISGSFRRSWLLRYRRSKAIITISVDLPFNSLCNTEKSVGPSVAGATTSPSMIADPELMCQASSEIFLNRLVQSLPRRLNTVTAASLM